MLPRLAVALDLPDAGSALRLARRLRGEADVLKVGLELFTATGPPLVAELVEQGWDVFLDLKIHDIPATAERATAAATRLGVAMLTLHTAGGAAMLSGARSGRGDAPRPALLGVTVLTSLDDVALASIGAVGSTADLVQRRTALAHDAGIDGVVCSVHEAAAVKASCGREFMAVTPGIRPAGAARGDQARVATPAQAVAAGADVLVVGRPIVGAADPVAAARSIRAEMGQA